MKKYLAIAIAAGLLSPAAAFAQPDRTQDRSHYEQSDSRNAHKDSRAEEHRNEHAATQRGNEQRFSKGDRFDRSRAANYRRISYRENRHLSAPSRGTVWVRSGHDALLVQLSNNIVRQVVTGLF